MYKLFQRRWLTHFTWCITLLDRILQLYRYLTLIHIPTSIAMILWSGLRDIDSDSFLLLRFPALIFSWVPPFLSPQLQPLLSGPPRILPEGFYILVFKWIFQVGMSITLLDDLSIEKDLLSSLEYEDTYPPGIMGTGDEFMTLWISIIIKSYPIHKSNLVYCNHN